MNPNLLLKQIRRWTILFIIVLFLSGVTVFPIASELKWILDSAFFAADSTMGAWLVRVYTGVRETQAKFPFLFYGFDWLAFAHIAIAALFIGVYKHPMRNRWIIHWAIITCTGVFPLAFIAGTTRGIPFFHILIDCSFGLLGLIPLFIINRKINALKTFANRRPGKPAEK